MAPPETEPVLWLRQVAESTRAFRVLSVVRRESGPVELIATLEVPESRTRVCLLIVTRSRLTPREALGLTHHLRAHQHQLPPGVLTVSSRHVSERTARICEDAGVSYLDGAGNCRLAGLGLFVLVTGKPNPRPDTRPAKNPFARKSSRVVRLFLSQSHRPWLVKELAEEADISMGLASRVSRWLVEQSYVDEIEGALRTRDPRQLLAAWAARYAPSAAGVRAYSMLSPEETERRLASACECRGTTYALTGLSAAWRYAPEVRYTQPSAYVGRPGDGRLGQEILLEIEARPVDSGSNLVIMFTDDAGVFMGARQIAGLSVASPLQTYLDLINRPGRSEEAARAILEKCLAPSFSGSGEGAPESESR